MSRRWDELLMDDHQATEKVIAAMENAFDSPGGPPTQMVEGMTAYFSIYLDQCHHMKEEKHLFPLMERRGVPRHGGPLGVMLAEHEKSREILARLKPLAAAFIDGDQASLAPLRQVFAEYASLLKDHFWKENDILFPMATRVMQTGDETTVLRGFETIEASLGSDTRRRYYEIADRLAAVGKVEDLSFGLDRAVVAAILNTLPVELSFVDEEDTVRYFSHENSDKIFARSRSVIGMKVQNCHPQKSLHMVNQILSDFKAGNRKVAEFWIDLEGKKIHIRYFPVRAPGGRYLGCLEVAQDITAIQKFSGQRRLVDSA